MTRTNEITHLGLEGTDSLGHGRLSGSCLHSLDRSDTAAVQTSGGSGGYDGGGDRKGEANDGQSELHDDSCGTKETKKGRGCRMYLVGEEQDKHCKRYLSAMRSKRLFPCGTDTVDIWASVQKVAAKRNRNIMFEIVVSCGSSFS